MKFFKKFNRKNGNKGSTLIAVLVVTTILSLFLITIQPIMFNYANRSIAERDFKQADLSAISANEAIVSKIIAEDSTLIAGINNLTSNGSSLPITDFKFISNPSMGTIEAKVLRLAPDKFNVVTKATVNSEQRTITREITKTTTSGTAVGDSLKSYYFYNVTITNGGGFTTTDDTPVVIGNTISMNGSLIDIAGDLYIISINNTFKGNSTLKVGGNIYIGDGYFNIQTKALLNLKGTEYNKNNSPISSLYSINNTLHYCADVYQTTTAMTNEYKTVPSWVRSTGTPYIDNMTLQGGSYYTMTGPRTIASISNQFAASVTPANPVYIILKTGAKLYNTNAVDSPISGVAKDPRIVFILEGTAYLYLENQTSAIIYANPAATSTRLYVTNSSNGRSTLYGQVSIGTIYHNKNTSGTNTNSSQIQLVYKAATSAATESWTAGQYIRSTY